MFKTQKALALAAMIAGGVSLAGDFDEVRLRTQLAGGPLGGIVASGSADFRLRPSRGDRSFNLEVEDLNLPAGTTLQVWVNNEPIGRLVVSGPPARGGEIELSSRDGAAVPKLEAGDVVSLRSNAGTLLSGVLQRRVLDDSPVNSAPTAAPVLAASVPDDKSVLRSPLTGGGLGGIRPSGEVEFRDDRLTRSTRLFVEVNDVNLRDGSEVEVEVNGRRMGKIRLSGSRRGGELELDSRNGERVEPLKAGDMVRVLAPSGPILAGALQVRTFGDDRRPDDSASSSSSGGSSAVSRVQSGLTGGAIGGVQPTGSVDFRVSGTDQKLSIEIEKLNLPAGTVVNVFVGDKVIGKITVGPPPMRGGELEINTRDGGVLPTFGAGEVVSVRTAAGGVLLTGVVQAKSFTEVPAVPGTKVDDPKGPNSGGGNSGSGSGNSGSGSGNSGSGSGNSGSGSGNSGSGSGNSGSGSGSSGSGSGNSGSGSGNSGSGSGNSGSGSGSSGSGSGNSGSGSGNSGSGSGNSGSGSGNSGSGSGNSGSGSGNSGSGSGNSGSGSGSGGSGKN